MTSKQSSLLTMLQAVETLLDNNKTLWSDLPPVAEAVTAFKANLADVGSQASVQKEGKNKGYTEVVNQNLMAMASIAMSIAEGIHSYAEKINDPVMMFDVNYPSVNSLATGKRPIVINRCETILQVAEKNIDKLADYKVSQDDIIALKAAIATTTASENNRNQKSGQSVSATEAMADSFRKTKKTLTSLGRLLKKQVKDEVFLSAFTATCIVHDYHGRTSRKTELTALRGNETNTAVNITTVPAQPADKQSNIA